MKSKISDRESEIITMLRGLMIFQIIYFHSGTDISNLNVNREVVSVVHKIISYLITSAVPVFFAISGYLIMKKEPGYVSNLKKKTRSLILPYFIWNSINIIFNYLCQNIPFFSKYFSREVNLISSWGLREFIDAFFTFDRYRPILYTTWFIKELFLINLFYFLVRYGINHFPKLFLFFCFLMCYVSFPQYFFHTIYFFFFTLGAFLSKYDNKVKKIKKAYLFYILIIIYLSAISLINYVSIDWRIIYFFNFVSVISLGLIYLLLIYKISNSIVKKALFVLGEYSMWIYLFHEPLLTIVRKIFFILFEIDTFIYCLWFLCSPFLIILICLLVGKVLKCYFPRLYSFLLGNRIMKKA